MPTDQTHNVSLTAELNAFILAQVASGQYQNASEVVRASLRLLMRQSMRGEVPIPTERDVAPRVRAAARGRHARQR
jgi:antitoxin ParD1/3/4